MYGIIMQKNKNQMYASKYDIYKIINISFIKYCTYLLQLHTG